MLHPFVERHSWNRLSLYPSCREKTVYYPFDLGVDIGPIRWLFQRRRCDAWAQHQKQCSNATEQFKDPLPKNVASPDTEVAGFLTREN